jgi:hypothetical protein
MSNLLKTLLRMIQDFVNKYFPMLIQMIDDIVSFKFLKRPPQKGKEETSNNEFFTSKEEEKKFHYDLADFIRSKKLRPELAYYMFCHDKKAEHTRLDNEMKNFLMVPNNSRDVIKLISSYPRLSSSIMPDGHFDAAYSKSFNRYLLPILFEPNSSLTLARYTRYFYRLVKS